jgi:hypothetical protein
MHPNRFVIESGITLDVKNIIYNPDDNFFINYLKPYYVITKNHQYLFATTQLGRRPDRVFYMVPDDYRLGRNQRRFDTSVGKKLYEVIFEYLMDAKVIVQDGIQGEGDYEVGIRIVTSIMNPHSAYIAWMGKLMIFPPKKNMKFDCFNYIIPEPLPYKYIKKIKQLYSDYNPEEPITLFDFTDISKNIRRVLNLHIDYFGGAFKKPNLTMVWNKGECDGLISYHAGCTKKRVLKGLSGTGKTTLSVGADLEQDDAILGKPIYDDGKINGVQLIGLEAASFAKSEGLTSESPEWAGLMKSAMPDKSGRRAIVLAMNIDCEGVEYVYKKINSYRVKIPVQIKGERIGSLQCTRYEKSGTTNGRFIFKFSELNKDWCKGKKYLRAESLSFKRFDVVEPIFRVIDPNMAVALDSGCESIITSAIAEQKIGTRIRSYAATDFMVGEQTQQALLKLKLYKDMGLGLDGRLIFFITNSGYIGEHDINGNQIRKVDENNNPILMKDERGEVILNEAGEPVYKGQGEKITVSDSKKLIYLVENNIIKKWIEQPIYKYLIPLPEELEELGMKNFRARFNPLKYYTAEQIIEFAKRDIEERTKYLEDLFAGQKDAAKLEDIIYVWKRIKLPSEKYVKEFYEQYYEL